MTLYSEYCTLISIITHSYIQRWFKSWQLFIEWQWPNDLQTNNGYNLLDPSEFFALAITVRSSIIKSKQGSLQVSVH